MKIKVKLSKPEGGLLKMMDGNHKAVATASTNTFREAGNIIKQAARANIAAGGFSGRWQNAMRVNVYPKNGVSGKPKIFAFHKIKYAGQFENPEQVQGHPYVWLPILANLPGGTKTRWTPALFTRTVGPLRGGRNGTRPILFGQVSVRGGKVLPLTRKGARAKQAAKSWMPVFIGVTQVNDPKRFNITAVVEQTAAQLAQIFSAKWEES